MIKSKGLLIVTCDQCRDVSQVPSWFEPKLLISDFLKCPTCGHENEISDEFKQYMLQSAAVCNNV